MPAKAKFTAKKGECHICADAGILPSEAIACVLHSTVTIDQFRAEVAALKNTAGAGAKLHHKLADFFGQMPSPDASEEYQSVIDLHNRLERVEKLLELVLAVAQWDDAQADKVLTELFPPKRKRPKSKREKRLGDGGTRMVCAGEIR